jgi:small subunit ribosomal protein S16
MAVKMRLMRMGKKKQPMYRVVVIDGRAPRDGRYIEQIGRYAPLEDPSLVEIDNEKAAEWLSKGAQPTEAVEKLLNISGAMNTMKVRTGQIHTVGATAPTAEEADEEVAAEDSEVTGGPETSPTEDVATEDAATEEVIDESVTAEVMAEGAADGAKEEE